MVDDNWSFSELNELRSKLEYEDHGFAHPDSLFLYLSQFPFPQFDKLYQQKWLLDKEVRGYHPFGEPKYIYSLGRVWPCGLIRLEKLEEAQAYITWSTLED
jgi:hypothetical protein